MHIAYGPDTEHYTLNQCAACACRAWFNDAAKHRTRWLAHTHVATDNTNTDMPTHWM